MNVKEAVGYAKQALIDVFADEKLINVGLEEVQYEPENNIWAVTFGFSRSWDEPTNSLVSMMQTAKLPRSYKVVRVNDNGLMSITNRGNVD